MSSEGMSSPKRELAGRGGRDIISTLPPELLDEIFTIVRLVRLKFDFLHLGLRPQKPTGAISKHLLPYTRSAAFHTLRVRNQASLMRLCRVLRDDGELASFVRDLSIRLDGDRLDVGDGWLFRLFSTLTSLRYLTLNSTACIALTLSDRFAHSCLPLLRGLVLETLNTIAYDELAHIRHYPALVKLTLVFHCGDPRHPIQRQEDSILRAGIRSPSEPSITSLQHLCIRRGDGGSYSGAVAMTSYFRDLRQFTLADNGYRPRVDLNIFLRAADPSVLSLSLSLPQSGKFKTDVLPPVDTSLSNFTKLEHLTIDHPATGPALYDVLRELPLVSLTFGPRSRPHGQQLITLLQGDGRIRTLKHLHLSNVGGHIGPPVTYHPALDKWEYSYDPEQPGWVFPNWTDEFDKDDVDELQEVLVEAEFYMDGSVWDAVEVLEEYWGQLQYLRDIHSQMGDDDDDDD